MRARSAYGLVRADMSKAISEGSFAIWLNEASCSKKARRAMSFRLVPTSASRFGVGDLRTTPRPKAVHDPWRSQRQRGERAF